MPVEGPKLKTFILGACMRCDRDALRASMRAVAASWGTTEQFALAALFDWMMGGQHTEDGARQITIGELERLPRETLESLVFELARLMYAYQPPPSRAS